MQKFLLVLIIGLVPHLCFATTELYDSDSLRKHLGLSDYAVDAQLKNIKVAVLDSGFQGFDPATGILPPDAELIEKYSATSDGNALEPSSHGLYMAQIIWALTGKKPSGPKFYLLN